ncbi:MAG: energy transducer TonB [Xanthobacteraceae bacterium]
MAATTTHGGRISRLVTRSAGIGIALIGHFTVLSALAYQQADKTIVGEPPAAIAVDIVSASAASAAMTSRPPAAVDDDRDARADAVDRPQAASVEQAESSAQSATTADPAITAMTVAGHSSPRPDVSNRRKVSAKRQTAPVAIVSAHNPAEPSDADGRRSATTSGFGAVNSDVPSIWKNRLLSHLDRYKRYPDAARARRAEGTALLSFGMDREGRVLGYHLVRSSGCPELDDEVLAMIQRASPLPPAPPELNERIVQLVVPVRFSM